MIILALWKAMLFLLMVIMFTILAIITTFVVIMSAALIAGLIIAFIEYLRGDVLMKLTKEQHQKIRYSKNVLNNYRPCLRMYKRQYPKISGMSYDGMPASPTPGNYQERKVIEGIGNKYATYKDMINNALNDVRDENEEYYHLLHKRFIENKTAVNVQMDMKYPHTTFYENMDKALLIFHEYTRLPQNLSDFDVNE